MRYLSLLLTLALVGCGTTKYQKTIASPYLGCPTEDITIEDENGGWGMPKEGWIAVCEGRGVLCVESRDSGGGCRSIQPVGQH